MLTGVDECQVTHVNVETNKQNLDNYSLKNVSMYSDVQYTQTEVVFRKAYRIGGPGDDK